MRAMSRMLPFALIGLLAAASGHPAAAQAPYPTKFSPAIAARADVQPVQTPMPFGMPLPVTAPV